ncbi:MATE family efflux transporter [Thermodesulfobacteriota bacterium]
MRASPEPITVKVVILFFLPLILMMELHQVSHTVIHAFLARLTNPMLILAAYSIAYSLNNTISSIVGPSIQAGISFISDRASFWRFVRFYCLIAIFPFAVLETIALTRLGDIIFGEWIGASVKVVQQARIASAIMAFRIFPILIRNFAYAFAFINRRTILITYATIVRLIGIGVSLLIFPFWLDGIAIGSAAFVSCMIAEAIYMIILTYPFFSELPRDSGTLVNYRDIWGFSWPLMIANIAENGVSFIINLFLGQLSKPDLALAAYGVVNALVKVILSPLKSLVQAVQTLTRSREDMLVLLKFSAGLQLFFVGIIFGLFYTPLRLFILEGVMGLNLELLQYTIPGLKLTVILAIFCGFSAVFRGMLSAIRCTHAIAATAGIRLVVITIVGSITLLFPNLNGAAVGVLAMGSAFVAESLVLGWRLYVEIRKPGSVFDHLEV